MSKSTLEWLYQPEGLEIREKRFSHAPRAIVNQFGIPASKLARDSFAYAINMYRRSLLDYGAYQTMLCQAIKEAAKAFKAYDIRASLWTGSLSCQAYAKLGMFSTPDSRGLFESFVHAVVGEYTALLPHHGMTDVPQIAAQLRDSIERTYASPSHRESMVGFIHEWERFAKDIADPNKAPNATKTNFIDVATASGWYYDSEGHRII